jgi:catechol 2,3-dioxygenase-like lactoylglutathione lyase family enzyme
MLDAADVIGFVGTARADAACAFYRDSLGLRLVADEPFALVFDAHGVMLRVTKVDAVQPAPYTVLGWRIPDIRAAVEELGGRGVGFERYPGMSQDDLGIWTSPSGAKIAWFRDPDGNVLSLTEF